MGGGRRVFPVVLCYYPAETGLVRIGDPFCPARDELLKNRKREDVKSLSAAGRGPSRPRAAAWGRARKWFSRGPRDTSFALGAEESVS